MKRRKRRRKKRRTLLGRLFIWTFSKFVVFLLIFMVTYQANLTIEKYITQHPVKKLAIGIILSKVLNTLKL